jgi:hypothetical protein
VRAIAVGLVNAIDTIVSHGKAFLGVRSCRPGAAPSLTFLCATLDHAQTCRWMSERPPRHRMAQKGEAFLVSEPVSSTLSRDEIEQAIRSLSDADSIRLQKVARYYCHRRSYLHPMTCFKKPSSAPSTGPATALGTSTSCDFWRRRNARKNQQKGPTSATLPLSAIMPRFACTTKGRCGRSIRHQRACGKRKLTGV